MSEITHFQAILPPEGARIRGRLFTPPPSRASAGGLILHALAPLRGPLDAALARGDRETALQMAYQALAQVADALAKRRGDQAQPWQTLIHALLVELTPLPYEPRPDGTLVEQGTAVQVSYRNWTVNRHEADAWAKMLTEKFRTLWPAAWVVLAPDAGATTRPAP